MKQMTRQQAIKALARRGIRTITDLDAYRTTHGTPTRIDSRFGTLKAIVGEIHAINIIESLAVQQCALTK